MATTLSIRTTSVSVGSETNMSGTGFGFNEEVQIFLAGKQATIMVTDFQGKFSGIVKIQGPLDETVYVVEAKGIESNLFATDSITVG